MRTGPKLALGGAVAALVVAWPVIRAVQSTGSERPLAYEDLSSRLGPLEFPRATGRVYLSAQKLQDYLDAVMPGSAPTLPPIDFTKRKAVLVAVGPRSSTGYDLRVVAVTLRGGHPHVTLRETAPSVTDRVVPRVTYPYRLITIPRTSSSTEIELQGRP